MIDIDIISKKLLSTRQQKKEWVRNNKSIIKQPIYKMEKQGYVYILTNPSFKEDWVKIGKSAVSVEQRVKQLDGTAVPLPFEIYATMRTSKYNEAEKLIHNFISMFTNLRIRDNREFFNVKPEKALEIFRQVAKVIDDAVIEETYKLSMFGSNEETDCNNDKSTSSRTPKRDEIKKWMIPANPKYFDLKGCLEKYGYVYWRQHFNFQTGDIIYVYVASPESAVRFKCIVDGHDLPYSSANDVDLEFYVNPDDYANTKNHNRFMKLRLLSYINSDRLTIIHLLENGMKSAPQGCLNLSHKSNSELLNYIEEQFN